MREASDLADRAVTALRGVAEWTLSEFEGRRGKVAEQFSERKLDALLVAFSPNLRYLTGFTGSNGVTCCSCRARPSCLPIRGIRFKPRRR